MSERSPNSDEYRPIPDSDTESTGLINSRSCTDLPCLFIFAVCFGVWIAVAGYAISAGNIEKLIAPIDSNGDACGLSSSVIGKKYLFFFDLNKCNSESYYGQKNRIFRCNTPQVCVSKCPKRDFNLEKAFRNQSIDYMGEIRRNLICVPGFDKKTILDITDARRAVRDNKCAGSYMSSKSYGRRCYPKLDLISSSPKSIHFLQEMTGEFQDAYGAVLIFLFISIFIVLGVIGLMRYFAGTLLYISIFVTMGSIGACIIYTAQKYSATKATTYLVVMIFLVIMLISILIVIMCFRTRIRFALELIKEASKAVLSISSSFIVPLITLILHICILALCIYVGLKLLSIGDRKFEVIGLDKIECECKGPALNYTNGGFCLPKIFMENCFNRTDKPCMNSYCKYDGIKSPKNTIVLHIISIVVAIWSYKLVTAYGEMVLAFAFATWYFIVDKTFIPFFTIFHGIQQTGRYHIGTVAFGSFILTVCTIIKTIVDALAENSQSSGEGGILGQVIACFCQGIVAAIKDLLKYINKNAYIMCSIYGKNFIGSAKDAVHLLVSSALHAYTLTYVSKFLLFLTKILIALLMSLATYLLFNNSSNILLQYKIIPAILVGIGTYVIATIFFDVYAMAVDTLFLCVLDDVEHNDGSDEKPYHMSISVKDLLKANGFEVGKETEV